MKSYKQIKKNGFTLTEALVSVVILMIFVVVTLPYFASQRKTIAQYNEKSQCRAVLSRVMARIKAGGSYRLPGSSTFVITGSSLNTGIYDLNQIASQKSSLLPLSTGTFASRFSQFKGTGVRLWDLNPPGTYVLDSTGATFSNEHDGISLYTPLLIMSSMSDLAEIYDTNRGTELVLPNMFTSPSDPDSLAVRMTINRYQLSASPDLPNEFGGNGHFWPIPRNQFGKPDQQTDRNLSIRDPSDAILEASGSGHMAYRLAQFPNDPSSLQMSWDYGFRVTLRLANYQPKGALTAVNCDLQDYFSYSTAYHNVIAANADIDILTPLLTLTSPQKVDTLKLSDKFAQISPTSAADKDIYAIFTGTAAPGRESLDSPNNRPECSQRGSVTKTFNMKLSLKGLSKAPGAIPMCLDLSGVPKGNAATGEMGMVKADGSDFEWCPGSNDANVLILGYNNGGASPGRQGWVPCEQLKFCHATPLSVTVSNPTSDSVEYTYKYSFTNNNNKLNPSSLWGCVMRAAVALVDSSGNLTYLPSASAVNTSSTALGVGRPQFTTIEPMIYFKPPPCKYCTCDPCKKKKSMWSKILKAVAVIALVAFVGPSALAMAGMWASVTPLAWIGATFAPLLSAIAGSTALSWAAIGVAALGGIVGVLPLAATVCLVQAAGSGGGACSPPNTYSQSADYYRCDDASQCDCGHHCNTVNPPDPFNRASDPNAPPTSSQNYCEFQTRTMTDGTTTWPIKIGKRNLSGGLDVNAKAAIGEHAIYSLIDMTLGKACFSENICAWDAGQNKAVWKVYTDSYYNEAREYCEDLKLAHELKFDGLGGVSKGNLQCLKIETEWNLKDCSYFNCQAYNGSGAYARSQLAPFTASGNYVGPIAGRAGGAVSSAYWSGYFPVQLTPANCAPKQIVCGAGASCESLSQLSYPSTNGLAYAQDGASYYASQDCASAFSSTAHSCGGFGCNPTYQTDVNGNLVLDINGNAILASCTLFGNSSRGSCDSSCAPVPNTCYDFGYSAWQSWNQCQPPPATEIDDYFGNGTSQMMCFEPWSPNPSTTTLCEEANPGAGTSYSSPGSATSGVDAICNNGNCPP